MLEVGSVTLLIRKYHFNHYYFIRQTANHLLKSIVNGKTENVSIKNPHSASIIISLSRNEPRNIISISYYIVITTINYQRTYLPYLPYFINFVIRDNVNISI